MLFKDLGVTETSMVSAIRAPMGPIFGQLID